MRKLVYYVATSLDGFIARKDGSFDGFVWDDDLVTDYLKSLEAFDTVLMGRKTYEVGLREGKTSPYPQMQQYVISRTYSASPDPAVKLVSDGVAGLVRQLKQQNGRDIYLCGGGELAGLLFAEGLIDEVRVKINPVLFGDGIPVVPADCDAIELKPDDTKAFDSGIILSNYRVQR